MRQILNKSLWVALLMICVSTLYSCNQDSVEIVTDYQKKNDAFVELVSKDPRYTKLEFLHESPIYYRVISSGSAATRDEKPLQNSRVSVYLRGVIPALGQLEVGEVKEIKDVTTLILRGDEFQHRGDTPTPLVVQEKTISSGGVTSLVKGMQIALQNMSVGDKWEVVIPWSLGYKGYDRGVIPAYSTLVFEIELVDILEK